MIVEISKAQDGMVLKEPVKDAIGRVLLPAGETLAGRHIEKLARWGIKTLNVEAPAAEEEGAVVDTEAPPIPKEVLDKLSAFQDRMFKDVAEEPLMKDLRELAWEHLSQNPDLWLIFRISDRI